MSEQTALVPAGECLPGAIARFVDIDPSQFRLWASFALDTVEGKKLCYNAVRSQDFAALEVLNNELDVANVILHTVTLTNEESGEEVKAVRTVLISPKGESVGSVSGGVLRSLAAIESIFGPPPWNPPLRLVIEQKQGKGARRYYNLRLA